MPINRWITFHRGGLHGDRLRFPKVQDEPKASPGETGSPSPLGFGVGRGDRGERHGHRGEAYNAIISPYNDLLYFSSVQKIAVNQNCLF